MSDTGTPASFAQGVLVSARTRQGFLAVAAVGAAAFVYGITVGDGIRAWQSLLVNFLFFAGLAQAGVVVSAILQATSARWGRSLKRLAEATAGFYPVALVLLLVLLLGTAAWAPWVHEPVPAKAAWLNIPFFVVRQLVAFLALTGLSLFYVYRSLRADIGLLAELKMAEPSGLAARLVRNWQGGHTEQQESQRWQDTLAPALLIAYGWIFTLVAFDLVMSLDPHWFSTLMGAYYFIGNLFAGIAFVAVVAAWSKERLGLQDYLGAQQLHDIGKLLFGFSILWAYMLWSQYLVIWYGDLPEETEFIAHRMYGDWAPLTWTVIVLAFALPFTVLLSRAIKTRPVGLITIAGVALVGMWLERFLLVSPSLWPHEGIPLGLIELLVTAGVGGLFAFCYTGFLKTFPILAVADPRLRLAGTDAP